MSQVSKEIVSSLIQIRSELNLLAPQDKDSIIRIGSNLENLIAQLSDETPSVSELLMLCLEALQAVYLEQVPECGRVISALSAALVAAEQGIYSQNNPVCLAMIEQAHQILRPALGVYNIETAESPVKPETNEQPQAMSLDDIAVLFIQLEAADSEELLRLSDALKEIAVRDETPALIKKQLTKAAKELTKVAVGKAAKPDAVLANVGKIIEQIAAEMSEFRSGSQNEVVGKIKEAETGAEEIRQIEFETAKPQAEIAISYAPDELPADADCSLLNEFITESRECIEAAEAAMLSLEIDPENLEDVNTVFRAFHTIKGTSAFLGFKRLGELAHHAETLLSRIRDREIRFAGGYSELALRSSDALKEMFDSIRAGLNGEPMKLPDSYADLMRVLINPEAAGVSSETAKAQIAAESAQPEVAQETQLAVAETQPRKSKSKMRIGDVLVAKNKLTREQVEAVASVKGAHLLGESLVKLGLITQLDVQDALRFQEQLDEAATKPVSAGKQNKESAAGTESSVRVRTDRLDSLIDMIGELVIGQSMLAQDETVLNGEHQELAKKVSHAGKIVRELQNLSMAMRMVPLKASFQKMARLVRDLSQKCGKQVEFVTEGEDTEIDRNLVDIIADPLVHMIRNALDHGIEQPDEREANGKSRVGRVRLAAYHAGGNVVVELQDDGKGLNRDRILQKAIEKGVVEPNQNLSDGEIFNLIFAPGFSTAEQVTDLSGRGVGMDVVRRNIEAMRGRVEISSEKGKGSLFTIRLPLTLAITDGMLVRVGEERFIVPTVNIYLSFRPPASALSTISGRDEMVMMRGELLPVFRLHRLFDVPGAHEDLTEGLLMVIADGRRRCALLVDELLGQQQVVAKSLGKGINKVQGVSGGAILGDGRVGLILDTAEIVNLARQKMSRNNRKELQMQTAA